MPRPPLSDSVQAVADHAVLPVLPVHPPPLVFSKSSAYVLPTRPGAVTLVETQVRPGGRMSFTSTPVTVSPAALLTVIV